VIDHPQFPAPVFPHRDFKTVAGHERFRPETVALRWSESPFPRDCLIDTQEKCLLRADGRGGVVVVDRFATELWLLKAPRP
jgi:hypothetical protein